MKAHVSCIPRERREPAPSTLPSTIMKFSTLTPAVLSALHGTAKGTATCSKPDPITIEPLSYACNENVLRAIQVFCGGKAISEDLFVPSEYASGGAQCDTSIVSISGFCDPPMWVPSGLCYSQFLDLCIKGDVSGIYGFCQEFKVEAPSI